MIAEALLVDDSRSALGLLKNLIEADGTVQAAAFLDPLQALTAARERQFDIALVDYEMPKIDGISFIRELRAFPAYADVPVVMITSNEADDLRIRALEAGATDFLPKRPHATELSVRLRNLIKLGASVRKLNNQAACLANEVAA
nr:two-component system response regulator [Afipia sp.]